MEQVANIYGNGMPAAQHHTTTEMAISRQAQEVQAAMVIVKSFRAMKCRALTASCGRVRERRWRSRQCMSIHAAAQR